MMLMIMIDVLSWLNAFLCVLKPSVPKTWSFVLESHITHNCTLSLGLLMWSFTMGNFESIWYKKVRPFSIKAETFDLWYHHLVQNFKKFPRMICKQVLVCVICSYQADRYQRVADMIYCKPSKRKHPRHFTFTSSICCFMLYFFHF